MSNPSWLISLEQVIRKQNNPSPRIAVVGMGQELRGDDAAGLEVARALQSASSASLLIVDAGAAPENFSGVLRKFAPDVVLLVDAVDMAAQPGTVHIFKIEEAEMCSATTHTLSPHLLITYLQAELNCNVSLIGIQIGQVDFCSEMSPSVQQSVEQLIQALRQLTFDNW
ncbi:MAG: hydrogenase maturation peptidase HycI [Anaerolineae bacterium]|nr:hydrogenase maturation peptidase HycI [Anaerolineae bacterium]